MPGEADSELKRERGAGQVERREAERVLAGDEAGVSFHQVQRAPGGVLRV